MASRTPFDKQIISVLKYDVSRPYLGEFTFSDLYSAQRDLRRDEYYSDGTGTRNTQVYVGTINGYVICGALWRLMEYNPVRFDTNPFVYNGRYDIFRFATDFYLPADASTADVISGLRSKLRDFLSLNAAPNGQWRDEIATRDGFVDTVLNDGRTGTMYKKLCLLRDAIKMVTQQNCADFNAKSKPYRDGIIRAVGRLHPGLLNANMPAQKTKPMPAVTNFADDYADQDRIDDQMESLQITLDNRNSVSPELYDQARNDMAQLKNALCAMHQGHIL